MRGMRGVAVVGVVASLVLLGAAIVERDLWSIVSRGAFVVFLGVLIVRVRKNQLPPRARTKQDLVLYLALLIPATLVTIGMLVWVAVVNDEVVLRVFSLACVVGVLAFAGWVTRLVWRDYQAGVQAAG